MHSPTSPRPPTPSQVDTLLHLALMTPAGAAKGELAFTAALLAGRGETRGATADLHRLVKISRDNLAAGFMAGADGVTASALHHADEALRLISESLTSPAPQVQPALGE